MTIYVLESDLPVSGVDAQLEGESEQRLFVSARLQVGLQQTLRRHQVVTSRFHILITARKEKQKDVFHWKEASVKAFSNSLFLQILFSLVYFLNMFHNQ